MMEKKYKDGEPCSHPGCSHHFSHPCEVCGRIGMMTKEITKGQEIVNEWLEECETMAIVSDSLAKKIDAALEEERARHREELKTILINMESGLNLNIL